MRSIVFIILLLLGVCADCVAQGLAKTFAILSRGDTVAATKAFRKAVHKHNMNAFAAYYGLGLCQSTRYPKMAFANLRRVAQGFQSNGQKFRKRMEAYKITSESVKQQMDVIAGAELARIINKGGNETQFSNFLRDFNGCDQAIADTAWSRVEQFMFAAALKDSTLRCADKFLHTFPNNENICLLYDYMDSVIVAYNYYKYESKYHRFRKKMSGIDEIKGLKDGNQMTFDEKYKELKFYGLNALELARLDEYNIDVALSRARYENIVNDKGSDVIDWHIGTWYQSIYNVCTLLALIDGLSDEQLREIYTEGKSPSGEKCYDVVFPCDRGTGNKITLTLQEIKDCKLPDENINEYCMPIGDLDVVLLTLAYFKRFGSEMKYKGSCPHDVFNNFYYGGEQIFGINYNLTPDDFKDLGENYIVALMSQEERDMHGIELPYTLPNGVVVNRESRGLVLSDGTVIYERHAYCYHGYDEKTDEFLLSGQEMTSASLLRLPASMAKFFYVTQRIK